MFGSHLVLRAQHIDVVGDEELARARRRRAPRRLGPRVLRAVVGRPEGVPGALLEPLVLALAALGQRAPLRIAARVLVQVHGQAQLGPHAGGEWPQSLDGAAKDAARSAVAQACLETQKSETDAAKAIDVSASFCKRYK